MEVILGVQRDLIENILNTDYGFISEIDSYQLIKDNLTSMERDLAETDNSFKQIIPYLFIEFEDKILTYERTKKQSESRLHNKLSIGIGGHINPIDDFMDSDIIIECLKREINEEIDIELINDPIFIGIINDDLSEVGKVHLGLVFKAKAKTEKFEILEKDKMIGKWSSSTEIEKDFDRMESWSQIVLDSIS